MMITKPRKREPEALRARLLDVTARIVAEQGLQAVTINAVCAEAGTTKGGLFHHFPNRDALIEAVVAKQILEFDAAIEDLMAVDPVMQGRFTRAYVIVLLHDESQTPTGNLFLALMADAGLRKAWFDWMEKSRRQHNATDAHPELELIRYAADGAWMAGLLSVGDEAVLARTRIAQRLVAATLELELQK